MNGWHRVLIAEAKSVRPLQCNPRRARDRVMISVSDNQPPPLLPESDARPARSLLRLWPSVAGDEVPLCYVLIPSGRSDVPWASAGASAVHCRLGFAAGEFARLLAGYAIWLGPCLVSTSRSFVSNWRLHLTFYMSLRRNASLRVSNRIPFADRPFPTTRGVHV